MQLEAIDIPIILLVEDDPDDAELTLHALKKSNLKNQVVWVKDGVSALDYIFLEGEFSNLTAESRPALVLLDLQLPKIDGLEVLGRIRKDERSRNLLVVILTSSDDDEDIIKSYDLFANSYIQKPVDFQSFVSTVQHLGMYWMVLNK
ncbi:MAG: response regulator, partial [Magnetococcales bacterium]|nr:response regulator [Magnetococcales bacterium]